MTGEIDKLTQWILPVAFIAGGFVVGLIIEKIVMVRLKKLAAKTKAGTDDIIISSLRGMLILWTTILGVYLAIHSISLRPHLSVIILKALAVIIILSATIVLAKIASGFVSLHTKRVEGAFLSTSIFANLTKLLLFIVGILVVLDYLGVSITPILTALGVGGLAVALALQETLSNLFSGLQIIAAGQLKLGDYIKLDSGDEGYVTDITWRNTTIRTVQSNVVVVPNSKLASTIITNYHQPTKDIQIRVNVGVSYDSNLEKVESVTIEVAKGIMKEVSGGIPEYEPFIRYNSFGDFAINFAVFMRAKEFADQYLIIHEFIKRLHKRYAEEGIVIPFPVRTVHIEGKE